MFMQGFVPSNISKLDAADALVATMTAEMLSAARGDEKLPAIALDFESPIASAWYVHAGSRPFQHIEVGRCGRARCDDACRNVVGGGARR